MPYETAASGPSSFDCWGLVKSYFEVVRGIELRAGEINLGCHKSCAKAVKAQAESPRWHEVKEPLEGDVVAMGKGRYLHHVGVWLNADGGLCIHAQEGHFVIGSSLVKLAHLGFSKVNFFRYV